MAYKSMHTPVKHPSSAARLASFSGDLDPDGLVVGMTLAYKGDRVSYVDCKNLISKGKKLDGLFLLPGFNGATWTDLPGSQSDEYKILQIETGRTGARGNDLPDMIWISGSGYPNVKFGLRRRDAVAKFSLLMSPSEANAISSGSHGVLHDVAHAWEKQTMEEGW